MKSIKQMNPYWLATFVFLVIPLSGVSIDIYVPSLPSVSQYFQVEKSLVQLSITVYMIGLGGMQLFAGSISDSFGRRRPYIFAMTIYILATFLIPLSRHIQELLVLRFIQGIAIALTMVPMRSVILDLFEERELQKMMNYMTMAWALGPIIAPAIGGYLQHYFGWQACFYFLTTYSLIIFIITYFYLPETSAYFYPFQWQEMIARYRQILFHWKYANGLLINSLIYSLIILFSIVGPFLIIDVLDYSAVEFGHIALLTGLAWFLGSMTNRLLIDINLELKAKIGLWIMFIISVINLSLSMLYPANIYLITLPVVMLFWIGGIIFPNYFGRNIALFPKTTGSANALFGAFLFFIAGISSALGTFLKATTTFPLACAFVAIISLSLVLYYLE